MFSREVVSVTAAVVLAAHVVVGCCAHHTHSSSTSDEVALFTGHCNHEQLPHHRCDNHGVDPAAPSDDGGPCNHSCVGTCSFLASTKVLLPDLVQPAGIFAAVSANWLNLLTTSSAVADRIPGRAILPSLRTHLSKCVLLV